MRTLQKIIPTYAHSLAAHKCKAFLNSFVMIKANKLFISEHHCYIFRDRGYDILVHLDSQFGNWVRIDNPYNVKTLYCTPYEDERTLDISTNPVQMVVDASRILDNFLKSKQNITLSCSVNDN